MGIERGLQHPLRAAPRPPLQDFERAALLAAARATPTLVDPSSRLRHEELAKKLQAAYAECNFLTKAAGGPILFDPSNDAHSHFQRALGLEVRNQLEFSNLFCVELIKGTFECARGSKHARWVGKSADSNGKYPDPPEGYEFPELIRLFRGNQVRELYNLRHDASHVKSPAAKEAVSATFERLIGRRLIRSDDQLAWSSLKVAVMSEMLAILERVIAILTEPKNVHGSSAEPATVAEQASKDLILLD
jgi:hypothetical protein